MSHNFVSPVWALHETSHSSSVVAKDLLEAAHSDNIQPLALLSAAAFGNTLAICPQTQLLVYMEGTKRHNSHIVNFLKVEVGYSANDSASQLSTTGAGLRFLSLVATLLCTSRTFAAAQALESMMTATAREDQLLPTVWQLQDLLEALEYKLVCTGFADSIIHWEHFLSKHADRPPEFQWAQFWMHPAQSELEALVDAFRTLKRLGDTFRLRIRASICHPWIIGFTKWCLDIPPHMILEDGTIILEQPTSKVTLLAVPNTSFRLMVELFHDIDGPSQSWSGTVGRDSEHPWSGMVSVESFGNRQLRDLGFETDPGYGALCQALSFSLQKVKGLLRVSRPTPEMVWHMMVDDFRPTVPDELLKLMPDLWPSEKDVCSVLSSFLNLELPLTQLAVLQSGNIRDLPIVSSYLKGLRKTCRCIRCRGGSLRGSVTCSIENFEQSLAIMTRDILTLSLFDSVEPVLVCLLRTGNSRPYLTKFSSAIHNVLFGEGSGRYEIDITAVYDSLLYLCGHKTSADINQTAANTGQTQWIASACRGQVIYPRYLEDGILNNRMLLKMGGGPGSIHYQGTRHSLVVWRFMDRLTEMKLWESVPVDGPKNLQPTDQLEWQTRKGEECLELGFGITSTPKAFCPMEVLFTASRSLFVPSCPHPKDALLDHPDHKSFFVTPHLDRTTIQRPPRDQIAIAAVSGHAGLRFFALAGQFPGVIRQSACLQCCIDISRRCGYYYVIC